ncbi:MAG TPA: glycosyltransferase family 4 protein [Candidatus Limnocylindrales bacterium]|nr:glycosyltransferase family 4 protein [Candidatus Limnocylindrales bacterium]
MKIGLVFDDSLDRNDGVQQYVRSLGRWLATEGHEVHYLVGETKQKSSTIHSLAKNITMRFNGNSFTMPLYAPSSRIRVLLGREQYDILHVQMPYSPLMAGKVIANAPTSAAVVGTFHVLPLSKLQFDANFMLGKMQRLSLGRFDCICSVSPAAQAFASQAYGINTTVIPNMINLAAWKNSVGVHPRRIVFLGRLVPRKGCKELLLALGALPIAERQNIKLVIAGKGPQRKQLEKLAHSFSLDVTFLGYITEEDKVALLASADLAIFPSIGGESFGIVLLEAMAAGAGVVIGGDNPGYRSVLGNLPQSLVDFKDSKTAAKQLARLLQDRKLRASLHLGQRQLVKTYDIQTVGQQIIGMYQTALLHRRQDVR